MLSADKKGLSTKNILSLILFIWTAYLLTFGIFQLCGLELGFKVWPLGEDRNWLGFMMAAKGPRMAHIFWSIDNRNPLQPWWWLLISPLLHFSDYALYLVRKLLDPLLALTTFLLLDRLYYQRSRLFAFSVALLVLLWNFNGYIEQITWNALLALLFTLLTIYFYCRYIDEQKQNGFYFGIALVCYFISLSTYTLQSGAIIAIAAIAFFRQPSNGNLFSLLFNRSKDIFFFLIVFLIYNFIWYTASSLGDTYFSFDFSVFAKQFLKSMSQFFYHGTYSVFWLYIKRDWSVKTIALILSLSFLFFYYVLQSFTKKTNSNTSAQPGWIFVLLISIAAPTIVLESTNDVWIPGTRSLMLQQVWQPLLYVGIIFLVINSIPLLPIKIKQFLVIIFISILCSITILVGITYNHRLVLRTNYQSILAQGLNDLNIPANISPRFLIKIVDPTNANIDLLAIPPNIFHYGPTLLHRKNAFIRLFVTQKLENMPVSPFWKVRFGTEKQGVLNATPINNTAALGQPEAIPYKNVWIVFFDGKNVLIPSKVNKEDLEGYQIEWQRQKPIDQIKMHQEL